MRSRGLPAELRLYAHGQGYDLVERPLIRADETMNLRGAHEPRGFIRATRRRRSLP